MNVEKFVLELQEKYHYSEEFAAVLKKAIPAIVVYYGEDKLELIQETLRNTEIHIQKEGENTGEYLNSYFGTNQTWKIPTMATAFQHTQLLMKDNVVNSKSIIYIGTMKLHQYRPIDFTNDETLSSIIHEICHAIKGYNKLKVEDGKVVTSTGLSKDYYEYDPVSDAFIEVKEEHTGLEEALNSYDEAAIMTIMTGVKHEYGAYRSLTSAARIMHGYKELSSVLKKSQFSGGNEWIQFLGEENSNIISKSMDGILGAFYDYRLKDKSVEAQGNFINFFKHYTEPTDLQRFEQSREVADAKTVEWANQVIRYHVETNSFEQEAVIRV